MPSGAIVAQGTQVVEELFEHPLLLEMGKGVQRSGEAMGSENYRQVVDFPHLSLPEGS